VSAGEVVTSFVYDPYTPSTTFTIGIYRALEPEPRAAEVTVSLDEGNGPDPKFSTQTLY